MPNVGARGLVEVLTEALKEALTRGMLSAAGMSGAAGALEGCTRAHGSARGVCEPVMLNEHVLESVRPPPGRPTYV